MALDELPKALLAKVLTALMIKRLSRYLVFARAS